MTQSSTSVSDKPVHPGDFFSNPTNKGHSQRRHQPITVTPLSTLIHWKSFRHQCQRLLNQSTAPFTGEFTAQGALLRG